MNNICFPSIDYIIDNFNSCNKENKILEEYGHPYILVKHSELTWKCRIKYNYFKDGILDMGTFKYFYLEWSLEDGSIKGIYGVSNAAPMYVWPIIPEDNGIMVNLNDIKSTYITYPGFDWCDGFKGFVFNSKHGFNSVEDIPVKLDTIEEISKLIEEYRQFSRTKEAGEISKLNGGFNY